MANCRINSLKPPCGYNASGIDMVGLLDFDDFGGLQFENDGPYTGGMVETIFKASPIVAVPADNSRYNGSTTGRIYSHRLEAFTPSLAAEYVAQLNLALRRRYVVLFKTVAGLYHLFGAHGGAKLSYTAITDDGTGALLTFAEQSIYPLFEVAPNAFSADDWILRTGAWDMGGTWYLDELWKTI